MAKFADYGFNKSHAAAYALVAYQTAWLKANHPEAFLAACMSLAHQQHRQAGGAAAGGVAHGHPGAAARHQPFRRRFLAGAHDADGQLCIRYALAAVKKVGMAAMQAVVAARGEQPFADLVDFAARIDPQQLNRMQIENLVRAGAFDTPRRTTARGCSPRAKRSCAARRRPREERESGQIGLFGGAGQQAGARCACPTCRTGDPMDRLAYEAEAIGFHLTAHPLDAYARGAAPARRGAEQPARSARPGRGGAR